MSVIMIFHAPGADTDQYDRVCRGLAERDALRADARPFHVAAANDDGLHVVDAWDSPAALDEYMSILGPLVAEMGIEPQVNVVPVHEVLSWPTATSAEIDKRSREPFDRLADAWNRGDEAAAAATYVEDGCLIDPFGGVHRGHPAIAAAFSGLLEGPMRGTQTSFDIHTVRAVGPDSAFIDATQTVTGWRTPEGQELPAWKVHVAVLVGRHHDDQWTFVDGRAYVFTEPPGSSSAAAPRG